jgi:ABC-type phosphate/phosphonate transport system substrate-binding protein
VLRALAEGRADAGATGDTTWARQPTEGRVDPRQVRPTWTSPGYCHCNFTVLGDFDADRGRRWTESLLRMDDNDPRWRPLLDLEG